MPGPSRTAALSYFSWRKSRFSVTGECVEVAAARETVAVRDSKDREGPTMVFTAEAWREFLRSMDNRS
ncbi:DUF397 domain-containing protein [Trebonia kvetii]|uniref:DUF397 domain-containing protein n=1 Tax=Trebonia kvetii TaxID=2480626 RepID=A0A6P2C3Z3_9ACTN|nr:DUF397 domain-containing protein [Trebonia kvetii]TVZ06139.1 DUF397 domain-containing protein [Trebonia kvetii]